MFEQVEAPRFRVLSRVFDGPEGFLIWDLEFRFRGGKPGRIHGVSHLKLGADGRVTYHRDYWDAAEELYEKVPLLEGFMRWLKHRVADSGLLLPGHEIARSAALLSTGWRG